MHEIEGAGSTITPILTGDAQNREVKPIKMACRCQNLVAGRMAAGKAVTAEHHCQPRHLAVEHTAVHHHRFHDLQATIAVVVAVAAAFATAVEPAALAYYALMQAHTVFAGGADIAVA